MTLGKRFLRWMSPQEEDLRQEMRKAMAEVEAQTDDLNRTMTLDGHLLKKVLAMHMHDPEKTQPH